MSIYEKYLKYKKKYIELKKSLKNKKQMTGGFNDDLEIWKKADKDKGLFDLGPIFKLYKGNITNQYVVSAGDVGGSVISCLYQENRKYAFIPKIRQYASPTMLALAVVHTPQKGIATEVHKLIYDEHFKNKTSSSPTQKFELEYKDKLPDSISLRYMLQLYLEGFVDIAYNFGWDDHESLEDEYYVLSDESFNAEDYNGVLLESANYLRRMFNNNIEEMNALKYALLNDIFKINLREYSQTTLDEIMEERAYAEANP
jgi:hypothetical protein